ncbi:UDP-glucose 4-epimerase [Chitinivorax tropicus]|uniref:UDP-glucose 4-epimerase n=1 Tax=Chitinivorax tropicus TaxID=714531 RepID=A0A840MXK1_9PROT|nr:NAD-dependent epimerase/dehydratase family protein [Chitinivorax tropicus]MBB5019881.1 UDP-glucose 4-epimerase [Chitinivorax tropicus]
MILVTGGAGFIGSHSVDALLSAGFSVRVLDNLSSGKLDNLPKHPRLSFVQADISDAAAVDAAMDGVEAVLHLAAQVSVQASIESPAFSAQSNIAGFINVIEAARKHGVKRLVYASSAAVYGTPAQLPLDETSPTRPLSPYGLEKLINDQYAALYRELHGFSSLGMRYFNVYGPRQDPRSPYAGVISRFIDRLQQQAPLTVFGDGGQTRDFIFVKDVAKANLAALQSSLQGVCNIGTGRSVTLLQMIDSLGQAASRGLQVDHQPARDGDIRESATQVTRMNQSLGVVASVGLIDGLKELVASC